MIQTWYMFFDCRLYIKPIPTITSKCPSCCAYTWKMFVYGCIRVYTYAYIDGLVRGGHGSGAFAVRLSCTNPQKFINVYGYVDVLVREGCRPTAGALGLRFPCTGPSMCSNIRTEDGYSTHNPAFCHDVYVTHTSGVKNRHQCPVRDCGVSTRANICLHGEPTAPY